MIRKASILMLGVAVGVAGTFMLSQPNALRTAANAASPDTYRELNLFGDVFERVRADYVETPDEGEMIEAAINGMLSSLDPHSSYLSPDSFQDMQVQTSGKFGGLGIEVTMEDGVVKVVTPMDDTPAAAAGVLAGDRIIGLDGESVQGLTLGEAVDLMRGLIDTPITLTILREGQTDPFDIEIVRAEITIRAVRARAEERVGYLRVASFSEQTFDDLRREVGELREEIGDENVQGFIIDLRNNPGGLLDQAIAVSDAFLNQGEIVSTRGRESNQMQRFNARSGDLTDGKPVIVLINGGSASASEIVAGALQDHGRATIVGSRSFGKGSVQTIIPLGANGALRLTTAKYFTPSGVSIQATGIDPDIQVDQELPEELAAQTTGLEPRSEANLRGHLEGENEVEDEEEESGSLAFVPADPEDDTQLQYALELLRGVQVNSAFPPDPNRGIPN